MAVYCMGGKKINCRYVCKRCGDILTLDDVADHLFSDHPDYNGGSFEEALDEYDRSVLFGSAK